MNNRKEIIGRMKQKMGKFSHGKKNSITDIQGVRVSHLTVNKDVLDSSGQPVTLRTGATAVIPYPAEKEMRIFTGSFILCGKGEVTGYQVADDFCYLNSPIVLTNSFSVGKAYNAILSYGFDLGREETWPPFVIGLDDSFLSDMEKSTLDEEQILGTLHEASKELVEEGSVGIGLGLRAFGWKGGIGTSSRVIAVGDNKFTCGVLVATNNGNPRQTKNTDPDDDPATNPDDSLIIVGGVDVPLVPYQLKLLAKRLVLSESCLRRSENYSSSVVCILFSTANPMSMENQGPRVFDIQVMDDKFLEKVIQAGTEAVLEAIIRSLLKAAPVQGKSGRILKTIPAEEVSKLLRE
jgi:D-aminopeptidase